MATNYRASVLLRVGSINGISMDKLEVANCCSLPCYFVNGHNASMTVVFTASELVGSQLLSLYGHIRGIGLYISLCRQQLTYCVFCEPSAASLLADDNYKTLTLKLCGQIYGSCIDFPLDHSDICSYVSCPLQFGAQYVVRLSVFIKPYWQNVC